MSEKPTLPINEPNMKALAKWAAEVSEQARKALEVTGPQIAAAFESMRRAMKPRG